MLNPKLRELYSNTVIPILERLAEEMERIEKNVIVVGVVHCEYGGIVRPEGFYITGNDKEIRKMLTRAAWDIADSIPSLADYEYEENGVTSVVPELAWRKVRGVIPDGVELWVQ